MCCMNATDPRFVMPLYRAALAAGTHYMDMAMSLSHPHPDAPYAQTGVKLGDDQFALAGAVGGAGRLALVGIGVEPGLSDVFARHAADTLFSEIDEIGVRDGANLEVAGYDFAPTFSIWTTIEECLNPPVIWESRPRLVHHRAVQRARDLYLPGRHRPGRVRERGARGGAADPALGAGAAGDVQVRPGRRVHRRAGDPAQAGPGRHRPGHGRRLGVSPRDVVAACLPDPATLGDKMTGLTCAGTWVTGTGTDGAPREVYLYHVVDNAWSMAEYGSQAVVWQTAVNPVVALELIDSGAWSGAGVLGPEALPAAPFLDLLTDYGSPWACEERTPAGR